jgi:ribosome-binding protein aMBF1 (putative translation factor)
MASDPDANARYVFRRIREIDAEGESLGERVKRLREERGLSQRDLEEPGLSYAYISRLETGQRVPSEKALRKLAAKLGVTPLYLETGLDDAACPHCGRKPL